MYLATKEGGVATIQEVSSRLSLSQTHLMHVAAKLVSHGFLCSNRGRIGGISLAQNASDITVEDVIKAMEPDFALVQCFDPSKTVCSIEPGCTLKDVLSLAMEAFFSELRKATIAQITRPNHAELVHLFRLNDPAWKSTMQLVSAPIIDGPKALRGVH